MDRLQQAIVSSTRSRRQVALLFIDLDNFKTLNDTLGHDMGDVLLLQVTERLTTCVREGDTVARLGGDEFVVILEDLDEQLMDAAEQAEIIGEKLLTTLRQPFQLDSNEYNCTSSIGLTLFTGDKHGMEDLLKQADIAMYQAKKAGRNSLCFFDPQMQQTISSRVALEAQLRKALDLNQFQLYYQVQVDSRLHPVGAEALIRWIHPDNGVVLPKHFISFAEDSGLIIPIGHWLITAACAQLKAWQCDVQTLGLTLSVNISARQFHQDNFVDQVETAVLEYGINPTLLKLELTESILLENIENTIIHMNTLRKLGISFSLDDFGTGYSSLQYLKRLPLNQLKIDQSFVRDIATDSSDRAIVRTVIAMAQSLNLDVIAEGVETKDQRQLLLNEGCQQFQGYLFSTPLPMEQFTVFIKQLANICPRITLAHLVRLKAR